jgi:thymidylate synthase ThyX
MGKYGVTAKLVWDGGAKIEIPEEMGKPRPDQLQGSVFEQLSELAGRVCYDSVGSGRTSPEYHKHIKEVGHLSVYEHAHMTVEIFMPLGNLAAIFLNRPGLWVVPKSDSFRVTFNPRNILDWDSWSGSVGVDDFIGKQADFKIGHILAYHAEKVYPMMVTPRVREQNHEAWINERSRVVPPAGDEEKWISMFMAGSRGYSHEMVRHKFRTAVSQRSTRFVAENESEWIDHPLVQEFLASKDPLPDDPENRIRGALAGIIGDVKESARYVYGKTVKHLQEWLAAKGVDKLTARKQARGAARGYLGNALLTELIFSASVGQWRRMLRMRACAPADAEIRAVFIQALAALKASRYADDFKAFQIEPASDGLGEISVEK